ncbi:MAG: hypothetical protein G01um101448_869 [Parcubacteria group bacterium Gr01-1014_48]|nr:MAG: hypothetical protein Greene041614_1187 [Parcubacteria group bacterium Greene0416_14]TSC72968.1 MAG: hypothetical protein G01um101448_869 [Parcubacteria group bacterium Gr01-1014_48]TSC99684.1 MAG: hypothetical protein Greene101415_1125 [Parcubacteria group bacterium Greene1014_15]TSD06915.1 MAG: hypothetical protein Greene07144_1064 [Parcubacteria group bacterium Greene0714_4]
MKRVYFLALMLVVLVTGLTAIQVEGQTVAALATSRAQDFVGTWKGQCIGCNAGDFILELRTLPVEPFITGTIKVLDAPPNYGDHEKPIKEVRVDGQKLYFESKQEGSRTTFYVTVTLSEDGRMLKGIGVFKSNFNLKFKRVS